jgi:hypothetical protein
VPWAVGSFPSALAYFMRGFPYDTNRGHEK